MYKILILSLITTTVIVSCKNPENGIDKIEIAKQYYHVLDSSDYSEMKAWFSDSLTTKEGEYEQTYSQTEYLEFLKWDAVFDPSYDVLDIEEQEGIVKAKISKMDKRILFLHEEPMVTNQVIQFEKNKIMHVSTDYANFNYTTWGKNKKGLLNWIDENHPELKGFINDQTEAGGLKYLKAIELYKNRK